MATYDNRKPVQAIIRHYRGDKFDEVWQIAKSTGAAYDLSGKTVILSIKKKRTDSEAVETISTTDTEIVISGASNDTLTFNKVINLPNAKYQYDCEIVEDKYTIATGPWFEDNDVNR